MTNNLPLISGLIFIPLIGALSMTSIKAINTSLLRAVALCFSLCTLGYSLFLWILFDKTSADFQFVETYTWLPLFNLDLSLGIDGISIFFIVLTSILIPTCILASWDYITKNIKEYMIAFLLLHTAMVLVFSVLDIIVFYIFFESVLMPMFLLIGLWGARQRKILAAFQLFIYTLLGSVFMLVAITIIYMNAGTTDIQTLAYTSFTPETQKVLWIAFFGSFAVKLPMVPVHLWLPEAHVEAPTAGSVILAGILLKLGGYGFLRLSMNVFPTSTAFFTPLLASFCVFSVLFTGFTTLRQTDFKKVIAYTSVAHMGMVIFGMFACNSEGVEGSVFLMLSHGFVSSALFVIVGVLYDRHHTRVLKYYCGLTQGIPLYATTFLFFSLCNMGVPGTSSFIGELMVLIGALYQNTVVTSILATAIIIGGAYCIWVYNKITGGQFKKHLRMLLDVTRRELIIMIPYIGFTIILGVYPEFFVDDLHASLKTLLATSRV